MQLQKYRKTAAKAGAVLAGAALAIAALPLILPFVLGALAACGAERGVRRLGARTRLPRWARSGICVTALFAAVGGVLFFFCRVLWEELVRLAGMLPGLLARLRPTLEQIRSWLEAQAARAPGNLAAALIAWVEEVFAGGSVVLDSAYAFLSGLISAVVTGLPRLLIAGITTVVAAYLSSASWPELRAWLRARLDPARRERLDELRTNCRAALGGWVKAQVKLTLIVYAVLSLGLWLIGVDFALLFGGLIALLDALPVLGTGTALIPWALICFLQEETARGAGLLVLYAAASLTRSVLEPRLVGRQLGLHPLAALAAFYVGYRVFGVGGMLLGPLAAALVRQLTSLARPAEPGES